jgi:hypothetical protein
VRTLADGTHIAQKTIIVKYWRDPAGRTRKERDLARLVLPTKKELTSSSFRIKVQAELSRNPVWQGSTPVMPPQTVNRPDGATFKVDFLEPRTIAGFTARGTRTTTRYPAGSTIGNDRPVEGIRSAHRRHEGRTQRHTIGRSGSFPHATGRFEIVIAKH